MASWLSIEGVGTAETAAAAHWRLALRLRPDLRIITIRRPAKEVVDSLVRLQVGFDARRAEQMVKRLDAKLDQIERRGANVTSIPFHELTGREGAEKLWSSCLGPSGLPFDEDWYSRLAQINIQFDLSLMLRYYFANLPQLSRFSHEAKLATIALLKENHPRSAQILPFAQRR